MNVRRKAVSIVRLFELAPGEMFRFDNSDVLAMRTDKGFVNVDGTHIDVFSNEERYRFPVKRVTGIFVEE